MAWYDVVLGVATGGLYTIGKTIYQAGNAAEEAGDAAEQAGLAIAVIGSTIQALGEQLESTLQEVEELLTIKRLTPRNEDDLWDEEKERLKDLRKEEAKLKKILKAMGVSNPTDFSFDFWDMITNMQDVLKKFQLMARLASVRKEIHDIFYQEPGVLTNTIYNAKETLERFNTIEQPMIEDILDSLDDNLDVSEEVLKEVKKLFVTKKKIPISIDELSPSIKNHLEMISRDKQYYAGLIERKDNLTSQLGDVVQKFPKSKFEITTGSVAIAGMNIKGKDVITGGITNPGIVTNPDIVTNPGIVTKPGIVARPGIVTRKLSELDDTVDTNINIETEKVADIGSVRDSTTVPQPTVNKKTIRSTETESSDLKTAASKPVIEGKITDIADIATITNIPDMKLAIDKMPKYSTMTMQPHGAKVSASLNTKFDGYQRSYDLMNAQKAFYFKKGLRLERKYEKLANRWEEVPGIIPKTLDELHGVLKNVRTEEQPRIDLVLDNLNANLEESKETLSKANDTMDSINSALSILNFDTKYLKLGAMVLGGLVVLNLFFGLIVLIRMSLGY
ncbi:hypothetical protein V7O66_06995 [Methanolobus sp. ZRKC3]|uniref:hypothetical protein n=1 Tax=Methanolobus sp. ZRKC3 TaxID=3125786 RepID=UPI00324F7AB7